MLFLPILKDKELLPSTKFFAPVMATNLLPPICSKIVLLIVFMVCSPIVVASVGADILTLARLNTLSIEKVSNCAFFVAVELLAQIC